MLRFKAVIALLLVSPAVATAEEEFQVSAMFGGGVVGFVDEGARDFTSEGGSWEARIGVARGPLELEAAYIGTLQNIDALGLDETANLLGTGFEGDLRFNLTMLPVQPYGFVGLGWMRYDLTNADFNTSDVAESDNIAVVPFGIGVGYRIEQIRVDLRGTYRLAADSDLFAGSDVAQERDLHTWNATLRLGFDL